MNSKRHRIRTDGLEQPSSSQMGALEGGMVLVSPLVERGNRGTAANANRLLSTKGLLPGKHLSEGARLL